MNIEELADLCNCTPKQALLAHKSAEFRLNRSLPLPLTQADATLCCLSLCVLKSAVSQFAIADIFEATGLSDADSVILESLKPAEFAEVAEVAIAA